VNCKGDVFLSRGIGCVKMPFLVGYHVASILLGMLALPSHKVITLHK